MSSRRIIGSAVRILSLTLPLLYPVLVEASDQNGKVNALEIRASDGLIFFVLDGNRSAKPSCATRDYWMIRDEKSNAGKQQFAALLSAKISGRAILIRGSGTCARWGDGEDIESVVVVD